MRFREVEEYIVGKWQDDKGFPARRRVAFCILGPPGIGKTSIGESVANRLTSIVQMSNPNAPEALYESQCLVDMVPEDIRGMPKIHPVEPGTRHADKLPPGSLVTEHVPLDWVLPFCKVGAYGLMCLDDIGAATPLVQSASRPVILDRRVGTHKLSPDVVVMATGNRREDKANATVLPAHFRNAVEFLDVVPDVDEWCTWYASRQEDEGLDPVVPAFLRWRASHLSHLPKDADARGAFATPRSWAILGSQMYAARKTGMILDIACGAVGEGVASEFYAFVQTRANLVDPRIVLEDPKKAVPNPRQTISEPSTAVAMATALSELAAAWTQSEDQKKKKGAARKLLQALGWTLQANREFAAVGVHTFIDNGGLLTELVKASQQADTEQDSLVVPLIDHLRAAFGAKR